jgi:hypothetical protein
MFGQKGKKIDSKADRLCDVASSQPSTPIPYFKRILKRDHADHEQFTAKSFPFEELIPLWKGEKFDPHLINAATEQTFSKGHHAKGEGVKKRANFERFEYAFCLEWKGRTIKGVTFRDRCYNEFDVKSNGCHDHPKTEFKEGPNMGYYCLARGEVCNWGLLKDPQAPGIDDSKKSWTYAEWSKYAKARAKEEADLAEEEGSGDFVDIMKSRMEEFENWWRIELKNDAQQGGAQAAAARGYSLLGTHTIPPDFISRRVETDALPSGTRTLIGDPIPEFSQLKVNETRIANNRQ